MSTKTPKASKKKTTRMASSETTSSEEQSSSLTAQSQVDTGLTDREGRSRSSLSPARISRLQEKLDLQNLNDRLAAYIDKVRYLESENSRLMVEVQSHQETITREVTDVKSKYEAELSDIRKLLDDTANEKAKMQIEASKWKHEMEELQAKCSEKEKECVSNEKQLILLEARNHDLQSKCNQSALDKKRIEEEIKSLQSERDTLREQLRLTKSLLEEETLKRVDLENRIQSLKEEVAFKQALHEKELSESRLIKQTEMSEIDSRIKDQYDKKLADTLRELREQYERQLAINRQELESMYESRMQSLQSQLDLQSENTSSICEELRTLQATTQNLSSKVLDLESQNGALQSRVRDLERMLEQEREWHAKSMGEKEMEIQKLQDLISEHSKEYQDLLDIKVALDLEIAVYRKLLESEELRLKIMPAAAVVAGDDSQERIIPVGQTPMRAKRGRTLVIESKKKTTSDRQTTFSARGDVQIIDHCPEGNFVKLYNKGNKDLSLGGWRVVRETGEQETTFKFNKNFVIKASSYVTIWSSNSDVAHSPPSDLVMKNKVWLVGDKMTTKLVSNSGQEMASRETSRKKFLDEKYHESGTDTSFGDEETYTQGDPEPREQCSVM